MSVPSARTDHETLELAERYASEGRLADAAGAYGDVLRWDRENARAAVGLSKVALAARAPHDALAAAQLAADSRPQDPETLRALAAAQAAAGGSRAAAETLVRVAAARPDDAPAAVAAADALTGAGHWPRAGTAARQAARLAAHPGPLLALAARLFAAGRDEQGTEQLEQAARDYPDSAPAHALLGRAWLARRRPDRALAACARAAALQPEWLLPLVDGGIASLAAGDPRGAEQCFRRVLERRPGSAAALTGLAEARSRQGDLDAAVEGYEAALRRKPDLTLALNNLACAYARQGHRLDRALAVARRAVELAPRSGSVLDTLGWVLLLSGQPADAVAPLRKATALAPELGVIHAHLGEALQASGRRTEAVAAFRAALGRDLPPADRTRAQSALQTLEIAPPPDAAPSGADARSTATAQDGDNAR